MANPTTAAPTDQWPVAVTTSSTVGELARVDLPFNKEPYRCTVSNLLCRPYIGAGGTANGSGYQPVFNSTGFSAGDVSNQPCITFKAGSSALVLPARGFSDTLPSGRTIWCGFRLRYGSQPVARTVCIIGSGSGTQHHGLAAQIATNGTITLGAFSSQFSSASVTISRDKWYLAALTYVSTGTTRILQVYNWTDQAYVTTQATGASFTGVAASNDNTQGSNQFILNPHPGASLFPLIGDVVACGLNTGTMDPATNAYFAALVADPWVISRGGNYAGGGSISAAGGIENISKESGKIRIGCNRPTGGTVASYQFRLHRSTTPGYTPDSGTQLGSLQSSPILEDSTPQSNTVYYYEVEQTDGSTTVYSNAAPGSSTSGNRTQVNAMKPRGEFFCVVAGDSRWLGEHTEFVRALRAMGYRCGVVNMSLGGTLVTSGTASLSWQPNTTQDPTNGQASTTLLANAATLATDCGNVQYILSAIGINDVNTGTAVATWGSKYDNIINYLTGQGYKVALLRPWAPYNSSHAGTSRLETDYYGYITGKHNGTTIFALGQTGIYCCALGSAELSSDNLHMQASGGSLCGFDAFAAARDVDNLLNPSSGLRFHGGMTGGMNG